MSENDKTFFCENLYVLNKVMESQQVVFDHMTSGDISELIDMIKNGTKKVSG
jgi:hypothetical protein